MSTFPDGRRYLVDGVTDDRVLGRRLRFVLADGRRVWVGIGQTPDTPQLRDELADALIEHRRYIKGARILPPPGTTRPGA